MQPSHNLFLFRSQQIGHVDVDIAALTDPVESANALLQQLGVARKINQDQVRGHLEVAAFAPHFRNHHDAGAIRFGEPGGLPVALHQRHLFVEMGHILPRAGLDGFDDGGDLPARPANDQYLLPGMIKQESEQPVKARVV